ncbi:TIGR02452 family protein [Stieleria mannarensis]|uniref:TIGR02452 family protein n=1 Tax=Stieleria mannarensis TaxID=2755585 RepID=UPI00160334F6|nr:TIGR02452 family protein [Rhodopirellula sp. JC639]
MAEESWELKRLPCLDSVEMAEARRHELDISRDFAQDLGRSAVAISESGVYQNFKGERVEIKTMVEDAVATKVSIAPDTPLPEQVERTETTVQVTNETTLLAAKRLTESGPTPLALNFANGVNPGGGFLHGARAQEEGLCRSSALFLTLVGDPMYDHHRERAVPDSTDWAIYSPQVPVFRSDDGKELDEPWRLSFLTCAAPYAPTIGQPRSGDLLKSRIQRVLAIAAAYGHRSLVLGAWGCGAFENDPKRTAQDFRSALETEFAGVFSTVVFAITDWSPERRFLGSFRDVFL